MGELRGKSARKPLLLDLFCKAGGAGKGYADAGFDVIGVDKEPQRRYPFPFVQRDALDVLDDLVHGRSQLFPTAEAPHLPVVRLNAGDFAAIHASPPCQAYGSLRSLHPGADYPELIEPVRERLLAIGLPYVIENVPGAPLIEPARLCGSSVGLRVRRHRLFETNWPLMVPPCAHGLERPEFPVGLGSPTNAVRKRRGEVVLSSVAFVYGSTRYAGDLADRKRAMGIDWMTNGELTQAIPPRYTELIGQQLLAVVDRRAAMAVG